MLSKIDNMIAEKKIKSMSANIAGQLSVPEISIHAWMEELFSVLQDFYSRYGSRQLALVISKHQLSTEKFAKFDADSLYNFVAKNIECFQVDLDLRFALAELSSSEMIDVGEFCIQNKMPALHILGEDSQLYNTDGRAIAFYNFVHPEVSIRNRTGLNARSYRDYKLVIDEQGSKQLVNKIDELWQDRDRRILIAKKTEKILQTFLAKWLNDNIHDAKVVSEVGKISGVDRTDIELTSLRTGDNIIIEVKWMGENFNGTSHNTEIIDEGIKQICAYLNRDSSALEGCVVCYDGRTDIKDYTPGEPIARLAYRIVWLESRSGSQIGAEG